MRWNFHGLTIAGETPDPELRARWGAVFASRPASPAEPDLTCALDLTSELPPAPAGPARFRQGDFLEYYLSADEQTAVARFPRYGQLRLDLARGRTDGVLLRPALDAYGVLEDLLAIALSPHLRRRGWFLIHAFAAVAPRTQRAVLIVGAIGAGKTTTGLALLAAGWRLLSNDSPIVRAPADLLSYPGRLAAYPESFARFPATRHLAAEIPAGARRKLSVAAEAVWPEVWAEQASCAAIVFPVIEPRAEHALEPLSAPEALRQLLPHAVEQWDRALLPAHLAVLSGLAQAAPAYRLRLGPDVAALPALLAPLCR